MFSHITIGSNDLERSTKFYDAVMSALGHDRFYSGDGIIGYGKPADNQTWIVRPFDGRAATIGNGTHIAFLAQDRASVDAFHKAALANGGRTKALPACGHNITTAITAPMCGTLTATRSRRSATAAKGDRRARQVFNPDFGDRTIIGCVPQGRIVMPLRDLASCHDLLTFRANTIRPSIKEITTGAGCAYGNNDKKPANHEPGNGSPRS